MHRRLTPSPLVHTHTHTKHVVLLEHIYRRHLISIAKIQRRNHILCVCVRKFEWNAIFIENKSFRSRAYSGKQHSVYRLEYCIGREGGEEANEKHKDEWNLRKISDGRDERNYTNFTWIRSGAVARACVFSEKVIDTIVSTCNSRKLLDLVNRIRIKSRIRNITHS